MPIKLKYDFVKKTIEDNGYLLLDLTYINNLQKLKMICPNNHLIKMTWGSFNSGHRCRQCNFDMKRNDSKKIKEYINDCGFKLLTSYIRSTDKIKLQCPKGHIFNTRWYNFNGRYRCPQCYFNDKTITIDEIKDFADKFGYKCLTKKYIVNKQLEFICPNGHYYKVLWYDFKRGNRCVECLQINRRKSSLIKVKVFAKSINYICLSDSYINATQKLKFVCPKNHKFEMGWDSFKRGHRCPECWRINNFGDGNPAWRGGISFEPYCEQWSDKEYKESIKERDGYRCLNPECNKKCKTICIHHIDYNKKNCHPLNLITVCISCNSKANKNRKWHKSWYQAIMYRRGCNMIYLEEKEN